MAFLMHLYSNLQSNPFAGSKSRRSPGRQKCHVSSSPQVTAIRHGMSHASVLKQLSTLLQVPNHAGLLAGRNALSCPTPKSQPSDMVCLMHPYSNLLRILFAGSKPRGSAGQQKCHVSSSPQVTAIRHGMSHASVLKPAKNPFCRFKTTRGSRPAEMPCLVQPQVTAIRHGISHESVLKQLSTLLQVPNHAGLQASRNAISRPALKSQPSDMAFLMNLYSNSYQPFCRSQTMRISQLVEMPCLLRPH